MKILAFEKELSAPQPPDYQPLLKAEARKIWQLQQADILREVYFRADQHTAVLVLECRHVEEAAGLLSSLPLVQAGLIAFEFIPLKPYDGFSRLIN